MNQLPADVQKLVQAVFGVTIVSSDSMPIGDYSKVFKVIDDSGNCYILKQHSELNLSSNLALKFLSEVQFKWMPKQYVSSNGNVWEPCNQSFVSLQDFIDTEEPLRWDSVVSDDVYEDMGKLLYDLHCLVLPEPLKMAMARETYIPRHLDDWRMTIEKLSQIDSDHINRRLKKNIDNEKQKITELVDRSLDLGRRLNNEHRDLVLVHGDFHLGNIVKPQSDHIYLIDWDWPLLSFPENDMMMFTDLKEIVKIKKGYADKNFPNPVAHAYYRLGKTIRGLWFHAKRASDESYSSTKRMEFLGNFEKMLEKDGEVDRSLNFSESVK